MAGKIKVDGIEVSVSASSFDDIDVIECIADAANPDSDQQTQMVAVVKLLRMVFGSDYKRVKSELRKRNGGRLTVETMSEFMNRCAEAVQAKN